MSIEGPSGSGKTTLLSILGLLDTPTAGNYLLGGKPAANLTARERALMRNRHIGFIFQSFNLIGDLTVFENVELPLTYRGMPAAERKQAGRGGAGAGGHEPPRAATCRRSCRAASSSGWRWRGRWPAIRWCCWPTSPPATWTRRTATR